MNGYKKKTKPALWTQTPKQKTLRELALSEIKLEKQRNVRERREKQLKSRLNAKKQHSRHSIKPQSAKRASESRIYSQRVKEWIVGKICRRCIRHKENNPATECHHSHGRRGALLLYEPLWIPLCTSCHNWVHANPAEARVVGLLCPLGSWNNQSLAK